jgi:hypothetical protein
MSAISRNLAMESSKSKNKSIEVSLILVIGPSLEHRMVLQLLCLPLTYVPSLQKSGKNHNISVPKCTSEKEYFFFT